MKSPFAIRYTLLVSLVLLAIPIAVSGRILQADESSGQEAESAVQHTIDLLFDGMREGDAMKVRSVFADGAVMGRPRSEDGVTTFEFRSVDGFVTAVGRPHEEVWDERIGGVEIRVDGHLASAWMEYGFYLGDDLHHCGVNSMQLVRLDRSWKIVALLDTDRGLVCSEELDS